MEHIHSLTLTHFRMKFSNTLFKGGLLVALMVLCANFAMAQRTVKGKVTDADNGESLIGATVTVDALKTGDTPSK